MRDLTLALIQQPLVWHDREANLRAFAEHVRAAKGADLILLPEMFTTGFTMATEQQAETGGRTLAWMQALAAECEAAIAASVSVRDSGDCYNRLYLITADRRVYEYDKRHLLGLAGEDRAYTPGNRRLIVELHGWRICPLICYDLRFPAWSRNRDDYDLLFYVANWPAVRRRHWRTLLEARAIENQCWCAGLNRIGSDGNGIDYAGDSLIIDPLGEIVADAGDRATTLQHTLSGRHLKAVREQLPFLGDADDFRIAANNSFMPGRPARSAAPEHKM